MRLEQVIGCKYGRLAVTGLNCNIRVRYRSFSMCMLLVSSQAGSGAVSGLGL